MCSAVLVGMDSVKVEDEPEGLLACRICLALDLKMYNICETGLEQTFSELMGISLSVWDGFPQHVCAVCRALLLKAQALRARCRRADALLKQAISQQQIITNGFIRTIDRATHKLDLTLSKKDLLKISYQFYYEREDTQIDIPDKPPCNDIVKDEFESQGDKADVDRETDILLIHVLESDTKEFETNCDDVDHSDEETKNIEVHHYKIEVENVEAKPALAEVKVVANLDKQIKKIGLKRGRPKKEVIQQRDEGKAKKKSGEKKGKVENVEEKNTEPGRFFNIEEIEEFVKKHNFEIQYLTDEEMAEDMEKRKVSDRYKHCKFKCNLCYRGFLTTTTFEKHMRKSHDPRNAKNECRLCRVSYRYRFYLRQHVQNAHRLRMRCVACGDAVWGRKECEVHAARHAGVTRQCKYCGKQFINKSTYTWHMRAAHPVENAASGSCELCGEIYTSAKGLKAHKLLAHNMRPKPGLQCGRCRAQFDNTEALRRHQELQGDNCDPDMSACAACGASCAGAEALLRHLHAAHHQDIFTCDSCNKSFLSKSSLSTHIDRVHLGIRPPQHHQVLLRRRGLRPPPAPPRPRGHDHMCEHCGKAYTTHQFLKNHQMSHTGERPFKCDRCPKGFTTRVQLKWHTRSHTGERPYQCDQCHQAFSLECNLQRHRKAVHLGLRKNAACPRCDKTFSTNSALKLHARTVHDGQPWPRRVRRRRDPAPTNDPGKG